MDGEWVKDSIHSMALLQISSGWCTILIRLHLLDISNIPALTTLLTNPNILKVGVGISGNSLLVILFLSILTFYILDVFCLLCTNSGCQSITCYIRLWCHRLARISQSITSHTWLSTPIR
jgi:hypothetical protein